MYGEQATDIAKSLYLKLNKFINNTEPFHIKTQCQFHPRKLNEKSSKLSKMEVCVRCQVNNYKFLSKKLGTKLYWMGKKGKKNKIAWPIEEKLNWRENSKPRSNTNVVLFTRMVKLRKSPIYKPKFPLLVINHDIMRFHVPMHDTLRMTVI